MLANIQRVKAFDVQEDNCFGNLSASCCKVFLKHLTRKFHIETILSRKSTKQNAICEIEVLIETLSIIPERRKTSSFKEMRI